MQVLRPVKYSRKCPYCKAVITLEGEEVIPKATIAQHCPNCDNSVFFTDKYGRVLEDVLVEYGLIPEKVSTRRGWK